jgi:hypothetical protein
MADLVLPPVQTTDDLRSVAKAVGFVYDRGTTHTERWIHPATGISIGIPHGKGDARGLQNCRADVQRAIRVMAGKDPGVRTKLEQYVGARPRVAPTPVPGDLTGAWRIVAAELQDRHRIFSLTSAVPLSLKDRVLTLAVTKDQEVVYHANMRTVLDAAKHKFPIDLIACHVPVPEPQPPAQPAKPAAQQPTPEPEQPALPTLTPQRVAAIEANLKKAQAARVDRIRLRLATVLGSEASFTVQDLHALDPSVKAKSLDSELGVLHRADVVRRVSTGKYERYEKFVQQFGTGPEAVEVALQRLRNTRAEYGQVSTPVQVPPAPRPLTPAPAALPACTPVPVLAPPPAPPQHLAEGVVRLSDGQLKRLRVVAASRGQTVNEVVSTLVDAEFARAMAELKELG